jgi:hypothetical protein
MFVSGSTLFGVETNVAGNSDDPYMMPYYTGVIVLTPQQVEYKDEYISLANTAVILNDIKPDDARLKYLLERIARYGGKYGSYLLAGNVPCTVRLRGKKAEILRDGKMETSRRCIRWLDRGKNETCTKQC